METLKYALKKSALRGLENEVTLRQYRSNIDRFASWAKTTRRIRLASDVADSCALVQEYSDYLVAAGYSPDTVHSYLAPVCKGFGLNLQDVKKPKRIASAVAKTRDPVSNPQGQRELTDARFARVVDAARRIGIRRDELAALTGDCLVTDCTGKLCVLVRRGKGGKRQLQRILPEDIPAVKTLFAGTGPKQRVFSPEELNSKVPLHALRRQHAQEAYDYYLALVRAGKRDELLADLKKYFRAYHAKQPGPAGDRWFAKQYTRFCRDLEKDGGRYRLRGPNLTRAENAGRPTEYDRVALMCVSVWHLAHWRNDVTVRNYMV